jgi:sialate O-acetylesterase
MVNISLVFIILLKISHSHEFSFGSIYQNNMVLQRDPHKAIIWGYAQINSNVSITFKNKLYSSITRVLDGYEYPVWKITLDSVKDTNPFDLEFTELNEKGELSNISLKNVLFGDVWLCGGQSNMQLSLNATLDGREDIQTGHVFKNRIRLFTVQTFSSSKLEYDLKQIKQNWSEPSHESLGSYDWEYFSAVCWHFGKNLVQNLNNPIGLLVSCWGGTEIERWMSIDTLKKCDINNENSNHSELWNSMIHPLLNFPIYGVVWYQGESNTGYNRDKYGCSFKEMVNSWRDNWFNRTNGSTNPNFPFGFVQLANSVREGDFVDSWPWLRWYQTAGFGYSPNEILNNVFMTTAIDLVDNGDDPIHPRLKSDIGVRLSLGALNLAYNQNIEYAPPKVKSIFDNGPNIQIEFESNFGAVKFSKPKTFKGFDVCCDSNECLTNDYEVWSSLNFSSISNEMVQINKPYNCKKVNYVRYLWRHKPCEFKNCPLYGSNLPVYPFIYEAKNASYKIKFSLHNLTLTNYLMLLINLLYIL